MLCFFPFIGSQSALIATHKQLLLQFAYTSAHRLCSIKVFCPNFMKPYIQLKTYIEIFFYCSLKRLTIIFMPQIKG